MTKVNPRANTILRRVLELRRSEYDAGRYGAFVVCCGPEVWGEMLESYFEGRGPRLVVRISRVEGICDVVPLYGAHGDEIVLEQPEFLKQSRHLASYRETPDDHWVGPFSFCSDGCFSQWKAEIRGEHSKSVFRKHEVPKAMYGCDCCPSEIESA